MIRILTGGKHSGKTSAMLDLYDREGRIGAGIYALKSGDKSLVTGYDLCSLPENKIYTPFIKYNYQHQPESDRFYVQGNYIFYKETFQKASEYILSLRDADAIWIDEIGKLELEEKGLSVALHEVFKWDKPITITVRDFYLSDFLSKYFGITDPTPQKLANANIKIISLNT